MRCSSGGEPSALAVVKALLIAAPTAELEPLEDSEDEDRCRGLDESPPRVEPPRVEDAVAGDETSEFDEKVALGLSVEDDPAPEASVVDSAAAPPSFFFFSSSSRCFRCCSSCSRSEPHCLHNHKLARDKPLSIAPT